METSLSSSWYIGTHLQAALDEGSSLLAAEQGMNSPTFTLSSPSLEMEAALQHLMSSSSCGDSELSTSNSSRPDLVEDADVLMVDPFLDFLNEVLMEEGVEDSPITEQDAEAYYQATLSSLYDIIGEHSSPASTLTPETASVSHLSQQCFPSPDPTSHEGFTGFDLSHPWYVDSQQVAIPKPSLGLSSSTDETSSSWISSSSLPARRNSHMSLEEEEAAEGNSLTARGNSPISSVQGNTESSPFPARGNSRFSLEQGRAKINTLPARGNSHGSMPLGKPEILPRQHGLIPQNSQVDVAASLRSLETSHASGQAVLNAFSDSRSSSGREAQDQQQGTGNIESSLSNGNPSFKPTSIDISFEELKDEVGYASLYVGKPIAKSAAQDSSLNGNKKKSSNRARKGSKSGRNGNKEVLGFVDVREVLVNCAQAVAIGDGRRATEILRELYQVHGVSLNGNGLQRTAHFFCEALVARMGGMGGHQFRVMCANMPSAATFLRTARLLFETSPYGKIMHYFANQNVLEVAEGASRLHIVDYGMLYGMQWPCLINALADRKGGPPLLVITGIEFPTPGQNSLERLEENGRRLAAYAKTYNVPFQFHAIVTDKWEDIGPASLQLHANEVLVVNCMKRLRHLADETVDLTSTISPRQKLLMSMHSLKPHLLLTADISAACNSPFFVPRFRETLYFYSNRYDMVDTLLGDQPERALLERSFYSRDILNIVACEGAERVERLETFKQWDVRIKRAGFELLPIPSVILYRSRSHVKQHYHKDFMVHDDGKGWMLLGWKGRPIIAMSAWVPSLV